MTNTLPTLYLADGTPVDLGAILGALGLAEQATPEQAKPARKTAAERKAAKLANKHAYAQGMALEREGRLDDAKALYLSRGWIDAAERVDARAARRAERAVARKALASIAQGAGIPTPAQVADADALEQAILATPAPAQRTPRKAGPGKGRPTSAMCQACHGFLRKDGGCTRCEAVQATPAPVKPARQARKAQAPVTTVDLYPQGLTEQGLADHWSDLCEAQGKALVPTLLQARTAEQSRMIQARADGDTQGAKLHALRSGTLKALLLGLGVAV